MFLNCTYPGYLQLYFICRSQWKHLRGYKTVFMHNSAEHEICPANKSQITVKCFFIFISIDHFMVSYVTFVLSLFLPHLSFSFFASGSLCFVIVAFP